MQFQISQNEYENIMPSHPIVKLFEREIDKLLNNLSDEAKRKMWPVVNALRLEHELTGAMSFPIPFDKLRRNRASNEDALAVLRNLHKNKIASITVSHKIKYGTATTPAQYSLKNIDERPEIFGDSKTEIELDNDRFSYLEARLRRIQHPVSPFESLIRLENTFEEQNCIMASRALKLIAKELDTIPSLKSDPDMGQFLKSCSVSPEYYGPFLQWKPFRVDVREVYSAENILATMENPAKPLSKEDYEKHSRAMVLYRILLHYSCSPERNQEILFRILESSIDPLLFDGVVSVADTFKMRMNILLEHAGYFFDGKRIYKLGSVTFPLRNAKEETNSLRPSQNIKLKTANSTLSANKDTGEVIFDSVKNTLNQTGQEFYVLVKLMTNENHQASYSELLKKETPSKNDKRLLSFAIRNIKNSLGILPKRNKKNNDIIKNVRGYGYKLLT